jgi:hypothetical protein
VFGSPRSALVRSLLKFLLIALGLKGECSVSLIFANTLSGPTFGCGSGLREQLVMRQQIDICLGTDQAQGHQRDLYPELRWCLDRAETIELRAAAILCGA